MNEKIEKEIIARIERLEQKVFGDKTFVSHRQDYNFTVEELNFDLNDRAFFSRYSKDMSGPQKFTLIVAYLAKGDADLNILLSKINDTWNKLRGLLGGSMRSIYGTRAKEKGWVDSEKFGVYNLSSKEWKNVFSKK